MPRLVLRLPVGAQALDALRRGKRTRSVLALRAQAERGHEKSAQAANLPQACPFAEAQGRP